MTEVSSDFVTTAAAAMFNLHFQIHVFTPTTTTTTLLLTFLTLSHTYSNLSTVSDVVYDENATSSPSQNVIEALCSIIHEHYAPNTLDFTLATHATDRQAAWLIEDFLRQVLPRLSYIKIGIENINGTQKSPFHRNYNLIIVDGLEALEVLDPAELTKNYDITEFYLLYLIQRNSSSSAKLIEQILKYFWRNYIINVSLLVESSTSSTDTVELYTYFPFRYSDCCKRVVVASINRFTGFWHKPSTSEIFPPKLLNFRGCPLTVAVWDVPPYLSLHRDKSGFQRVGDFEGQLLVELAQKLNFSLDLIVPPNEEERGNRFPNGSTTGAMHLVSMLVERQADLSVGCFRYTLQRSKVLTGALPYYQTWQTYGVLLKIQPYTSLEILSFAFDCNTWLCLCLSLVATSVLCYFGQLYRNRSRLLATIMMATPKSTKPLDSIVGIFLGNPLTRLPHLNFTRFTIVLWFFYGHLIRTAYQSLLFKLLQTNLYRAPPQTQLELIANGYTLVMTQRTYESVKTEPHIAAAMMPLILHNDSSDLSSYAYMEQTEDKLLAGVAPTDFLTYYAEQTNRRGVFYILPEKIFTQHITMYFTKHSYLIERFNQLFMDLRSQGLIDYWATQSLDMSYFVQNDAVSGKALTYERIVGIFVIYDLLLCLAFVVFCLELLYDKFKKVSRVAPE